VIDNEYLSGLDLITFLTFCQTASFSSVGGSGDNMETNERSRISISLRHQPARRVAAPKHIKQRYLTIKDGKRNATEDPVI